MINGVKTNAAIRLVLVLINTSLSKNKKKGVCEVVHGHMRPLRLLPEMDEYLEYAICVLFDSALLLIV